MAAQTIILDPDLIHRLALTPANVEAAGLQSGVALDVSVESGRIVLALSHAIDDENRSRTTEIKAAIAKLRSMFLGQPSLEDEYYRNKDFEKW